MPTPEEARTKLYSLLGDLPPRERPVSAELVSRLDKGPYRLEKLLLDLNGMEPVPAYLVTPNTAQPPYPVVLYNHAHGGDYARGKEELIQGSAFLQSPPYADELTAAGYAALCIDAWNFGERRGRSESELFKELLWQGQVLWGLMVYDSIKAIDYLATRPDMDLSRLATLGLSMGSTMAWWLAALDTRVKVCVDLCCLTDFHSLIETRGLDGHGIYYYVPGLLKHFDTAAINSLIAPRAHLAVAGEFDRLTPVAGLDRVDKKLRQAYAEQGVSERWRLLRTKTGHFETASARREIMSFLERWL